MVRYSNDYKNAYVDSYKFTRDERTGYFLSAQKIGGRRKRLHVYIWEKVNGRSTPRGYHVHHIDGDKNNNEPENLAIMQGNAHYKYHKNHLSDEQIEVLTKRLVEKAVPKSKIWHGSEEGHKWHSEHGKLVFQNLEPRKYKCTYCGKEFETKKPYSKKSNTFCSNKCKSAYRRMTGVDNVVKICEKCGGEYIENKYYKTKYCAGCRDRSRRV